MWLLFFKFFLVVFSGIATFLSVIFMLSPELFSRIEEIFGMEFGAGVTYATILEGRINFLNDWVYSNRFIFGPLLAILAAINTRNAFFI